MDKKEVAKFTELNLRIKSGNLAIDEASSL
jgi:hypothetical protein